MAFDKIACTIKDDVISFENNDQINLQILIDNIETCKKVESGDSNRKPSSQGKSLYGKDKINQVIM